MASRSYSDQTRLVTRRRFLHRTSIAVGGALSTASWVAGAEPGNRNRRIGFVDDNLANYHADVFLKAFRGPLKERGFTITGSFGLKETESRAWAEKNNVPYFAEAAALNEAVDFYMILAPSTPGTHLELCQRVLPFKKPTYVDKTFAPDLATARKIFAIGDEHGVAMQTSSALRYTNVQEEVKKLGGRVEHAVTWGGGGSFDEYAIHPLELLISLMGHEATALLRRGDNNRSQLLINFAGDRTAVVNVYPRTDTAFAASVTTDKATRYFAVDSSRIFVNTAAAILDFFVAGKPTIDRQETLTLMRVLDAARDARAMKEFVPLS
jgi:predicted dehydrogenase